MDMSYEQELIRRIWFLENSKSNQSEINRLRKKLAERYLLKENIYLAIKEFEKLNDKKFIKKLSDKGLETGDLLSSLDGYLSLKNKKGIKKTLKAASDKDNSFFIYEHYFNKSGLDKKLYKDFNKFILSYGFKNVVSFKSLEVFNAAQKLKEDYDLCIGVAKGGLFSTYFFNLANFEKILTEAHRKGNGATFRWYDDPHKIRDKRILVLDKDVVSGRSLRKIIKETKLYSPKSMDLFLNHSYPYTNPKNIPQEFKNVFYSGDFEDSKGLYNAVLRLEEILQNG